MTLLAAETPYSPSSSTLYALSLILSKTSKGPYAVVGLPFLRESLLTQMDSYKVSNLKNNLPYMFISLNLMANIAPFNLFPKLVM